jgi:hypothetical protein
LTSHIDEIVSHFAATYPSLSLLPELFVCELSAGFFLIAKIRVVLQFRVLCFRPLSRHTGSLDVTPTALELLFEALLLDGVETVKPWLIHEDANAVTLRVWVDQVPRCLPLAIQANWGKATLSPLRANCQLVNEYSLLELSAAAGAAKCVRFFAVFLHCPMMEVAPQLAVRCGHIELMHDLVNRLGLFGPVPEFVILRCARAAIEHCRGLALVAFELGNSG